MYHMAVARTSDVTYICAIALRGLIICLAAAIITKFPFISLMMLHQRDDMQLFRSQDIILSTLLLLCDGA